MKGTLVSRTVSGAVLGISFGHQSLQPPSWTQPFCDSPIVPASLTYAGILGGGANVMAALCPYNQRIGQAARLYLCASLTPPKSAKVELRGLSRVGHLGTMAV